MSLRIEQRAVIGEFVYGDILDNHAKPHAKCSMSLTQCSKCCKGCKVTHPDIFFGSWHLLDFDGTGIAHVLAYVPPETPSLPDFTKLAGMEDALLEECSVIKKRMCLQTGEPFMSPSLSVLAIVHVS